MIIPTYLTAPYIAQALDSVLAQSFRDFETIVVNDGSPDTPELERALRPYMANIRYIEKPHFGSSQARNTGIANARAPLIALLDSDDAWMPDYLATQISVLEADPKADAVYSNAVLFGDPSVEGKTYMEDILPSDGEVSFASLVSGKCNVVGAAMMLRRNAIERAGLYDPEISLGEDLDLWLRFVKSGGRIVYHRRPLYLYRSRAGSLSHQSIPLSESVLRILDRSQERFSLTTDELAAVERARQRITAVLNLDRGKRAFHSGDRATAIRDIGAANKYYRRFKLRLVLALMRTAPSLLRFVERIRARP